AWVMRCSSTMTAKRQPFSSDKSLKKKVPADDGLAADAQARVAYLEFGAKRYDEAIKEFLKLASGEMKADAYSATDAGMRIGMILTLQKRGDEAIDVFRQVSEQSPLKDDSDYARLMMAGTLWESGKG